MPRSKPPATPLRPPSGTHDGAIRNIVGAYHVGKSDDDVIADWRRRMIRACKKGNYSWNETSFQEWAKRAVAIHNENRKLYHDVMSGAVC